MYLIDYNTFIRQAIPPHWRDRWEHHLIDVLCSPLRKLFDESYTYRREVLEQLNLNSQILSFEGRLNELNGFKNREIIIGDGIENGLVKVITPGTPSVVASILAHFDHVKIAGKRLVIVEQESPQFLMNEGSQIQFKNQFEADEYTFALQIVDNYLFATCGTSSDSGRLLIFDINDPKVPVFEKELLLSDGSPFIDVSGFLYEEQADILFVSMGAQVPAVVVLDVSDPLNPVELGGSGIGGFGLRPMFRFDKGSQKYLYISMISPRVAVLNVTDPAAITQNNPSDENLGPKLTTAVNGFSNYLFVGERPGDGLKVFDILEDPQEPSYLFTQSAQLINTDRIFRGIFIDQSRNYLYGLLDQNDDDDTAVVVFDLGAIEEGSIPILQKLTAPNALQLGEFRNSLVLENNFLAMMSSGSGLYVWDITDLNQANDRLQIFSGVVPNEAGNSSPWQTRAGHAYFPSGGGVGLGFFILEHEITT